MGVMALLQEIAASSQRHCERSEAIFRKVGLIKRLPQSLCSFAMTGSVSNSASSLICEKSLTTIYPTHPPRLSGFDREAQPWRGFYACQKRLAA